MTTVVLVLAALWLVACLVYSTPRFFGRISAKRRRRSL